MLGFQLPDNLAELSLDELHALHAKCWPERAELAEKQLKIKPFIDVRQAEKDRANRASFDTSLSLGPGADEGMLKKLAEKLGFTVTKKEGE